MESASNESKFKYKATRYPWDEWFARKSVTLVKGRDYVVQSHGFGMNARMAAKSRGLRVSITVKEKYITITVVGPLPTKEDKAEA